MSTGARIAWGITKWVVIPAALGFVGYTVFGPIWVNTAPPSVKDRLTGTVAQATQRASQGPAVATDEEVVPSSKFKPPTDIEIKLVKAPPLPRTAPRPRTVDSQDPGSVLDESPIIDIEPSEPKKRSKPKPTEEPPEEPVADPIPQDGGSGGASSAGDPGTGDPVETPPTGQ
ncbi:MAG: hypothetical protein JNM85_00825 [Chthonomonas sp.]|nr:hypothetical protein [Chthonomonas sp.]